VLTVYINIPTLYIVVKPWLTVINSLAFVSSYYVRSNEDYTINSYADSTKYIILRFTFDIKTDWVRVVAWQRVGLHQRS